jgi:predicted nucleotidyltransferase
MIIKEPRAADEIRPTDKNKIIALTSALFPHAVIYLFGSRATGTFSRGSDIDIALDAGQELDFVAVGELREVLNATNVPRKIDVVDFHAVSEGMRQTIRTEGIVWKK